MQPQTAGSAKLSVTALQKWAKANPKAAVVLGIGACLVGYYASKRMGAGSPRAEYVQAEELEDAAGESIGGEPEEIIPLIFDDYYPSGLLPSYDYRPPGNGGSQAEGSTYTPQSTAREDIPYNPLAPSVIYDLFPELNIIPVGVQAITQIRRPTGSTKTSEPVIKTSSRGLYVPREAYDLPSAPTPSGLPDPWKAAATPHTAVKPKTIIHAPR